MNGSRVGAPAKKTVRSPPITRSAPMKRENSSVTESRWTPEKILDHMRLPERPNIYVLGCTESRRVTVGSQQIRAINLVHSIFSKHYQDWLKSENQHEQHPGWNQRVLVVGGGVGGLTAAAFAAHRGAKVTVVAMDGLIANLDGSDRFVHPRLYEWGSPQPFETTGTSDYWIGDRLGVPLLDWKAGRADRIRKELLAEWEGWVRMYEINGPLRCTLPPYSGDTWPSLEGAESFDHVILGIGFGTERSPSKIPEWVGHVAGSYWQPGELGEWMNILVCGNGDGALTDLFPACLEGFRQDELAQVVQEVDEPDRAIEKEVMKIESVLESDQSADAEYEMARRYLTMRAPGFDSWVTGKLKKHVSVWLSVVPHPTRGQVPESAFSRRAFPLNRVLLASLMRVSALNGARPLQITYTANGQDLPLKPPREDKILLIFRPGLSKPPPIEILLHNHLHELKILRRRNREDITRRPIWPFFGEAINVEAAPTSQALIPRWNQSSEGAVVEWYRNVRTFASMSEAFDSVFQAAADTAISSRDADFYFKGIFRFYMLAFDEILLTDAQLWDGKFMLRFPETWESLHLNEKKIIKEKFVIMERPYQRGMRVRDALYLKQRGDKWLPNPLDFSTLGPAFSREFKAWSAGGDASLADGRASAVEMLRKFVASSGYAQTNIEALIECWHRLDMDAAEMFTVRRSPATDVDTVLECASAT